MEERTDQVRGFLEGAQVAHHFPLHLLWPRDDLAANAVVLQVVPDRFVGIQFGGVGRQKEQPQFVHHALQKPPHFHGLVRWMSVHDQEDRSPLALPQPLEKADEHLGVHAALHSHEAKVTTATDRRNKIQAQAGTGGGNNRRLAAWRPSRAGRGVGANAGFVAKPNLGFVGLGCRTNPREFLPQPALHRSGILLVRPPQRTLRRQAELLQQATHGGTTQANAKAPLEQNARQLALESAQQAALEMGLLTNAQHNAETTLRRFLQLAGYPIVAFTGPSESIR